jgi:uncharacterized damage-inducible protein DinB
MNNSLQLLNYNSWANTAITNHILQLPPNVVRQPLTSVFPSVFDVLMHMYVIDRGWYALLQHEYAADDYQTIQHTVERLVNETKDNSIEELAKKQRDLSALFFAFITEANMNAVNIFSGVKMTHADVIQHMVNHGTYHRGNISAMLHQLGYKGVPTDYGLYLYHNSLNTPPAN